VTGHRAVDFHERETAPRKGRRKVFQEYIKNDDYANFFYCGYGFLHPYYVQIAYFKY
jgi:hypothetical protein